MDIVLDGQDTRKTAEIKTEDGKKERHYLYFDGETVSGKVKTISLVPLAEEVSENSPLFHRSISH